MLRKLQNRFKSKITSKAVEIISKQLNKNGGYWSFLEIFTGRAGKYKGNREIRASNAFPSRDSNLEKTAEDKRFIDLNTSQGFPNLAKEIGNYDLNAANLEETRCVLIWDFTGNVVTNDVYINLISVLKKLRVQYLAIDSNVEKKSHEVLESTNQIKEFKPDLILFELHNGLNAISNSILNVDLISKVKAETGASVGVICFDIWRKFDVKFAEYWNCVTTLFIHIDPLAAKMLPENLKSKFILWPFIGQQTSPNSLIMDKKKRIQFLGSIKHQDRRFWIRELYKITPKYGLEFFANNFTYSKGEARMNWENYLENLRGSLVSLSLSQKSDLVVVLPFRTFESISQGCLVLQQELHNQKSLSFFFNEYEHYLTFRSMSELEDSIHWISENFEEAKKIGDRAREYQNLNYSADRLWKYLILKIRELEISTLKSTDL